ncbi:potassium/proton antiporter [Rhodospirillaceae bacterium KN72]|uniref:Potassium/proton antiporter n=1 Tax=Pacificispira spongiicola TaxID=2729598 RepID=A0A7Y0HHM5_9PROT|nr:potassium/proton antiporter [Pacificispira spongiicola]NMM45639.1 potassium/proton antiporter [Pacificispira spongiicola]
MDVTNSLILFGALLVFVSILAGMASARFGAPLLLVFLTLGMLAGQDGPGGIEFNDYGATYLVGSVALAIILFDGGLRTRWPDFKSVALPAGLLATVGVLVTAGLTGTAAFFVFDIGPIEALLVGAIVASTDAAAVFLILSGRGMRLRDRVRSLLEAEAGLNDPMAVLLTITCVTLLANGAPEDVGNTALAVFRQFSVQMLGGFVVGAIGGALLLVAINRLTISSGLYPVLAASGAVLLFAAAQHVGASGFLAVYVAGMILGNNRHKATFLISRFHDGLAWLCQIVMFLVLGLLVTPSTLIDLLLPAGVIALVLILIARPVAVALCAPFNGLSRKESGFVAWVGLRGAVPIFLATIPVLSGLDQGERYFGVAYIVVLVSLVVQGWSAGRVGRWLGVLLPPRPALPSRVEIDLPSETGRNLAAFSVQLKSMATRRPFARLPLPGEAMVISVIRDGKIYPPGTLETLAVGDDVLVMTHSDSIPTLDRIFGARQGGREDVPLVFHFPGSTYFGPVAEMYDLPVPAGWETLTVAQVLRDTIPGKLKVGQTIRFPSADLSVKALDDTGVSDVALNLEPDNPGPMRRFALTGLILRRAVLTRLRSIRSRSGR